MIISNQLIQLPLNGLLKVWCNCYVNNNETIREKLDEFDLSVTKRGLKVKDKQYFVQLTLTELNWIKNLYELVI